MKVGGCGFPICKVFQGGFQECTPRLEQFWDAVGGLAWVKNHPLSERVDFKSRTVPLQLFGDGIAVLGVSKSWGRSVEAFTIQPLLSLLPTKYGTVLLSLIWKGRRHAQLIPKMWRILAWSLRALATGKWPSSDWKGVPYEENSVEGQKANSFLAGGYAAVVVAQTLADKNEIARWNTSL